jgi:hypothetical protein
LLVLEAFRNAAVCVNDFAPQKRCAQLLFGSKPGGVIPVSPGAL